MANKVIGCEALGVGNHHFGVHDKQPLCDRYDCCPAAITKCGHYVAVIAEGIPDACEECDNALEACPECGSNYPDVHPRVGFVNIRCQNAFHQ